MTTLNLIVYLSMVLVTTVSGNMFNPFSSFPGFSPFPRFTNPFGSSFGSPFGMSFPFGQSFGSSFSSDDPFTSSPSFPFQSPTPPSFPSPFNRGFPSGSFGFPSFPSFTDFTKGMTNGDLQGNGVKVTSSSKPGNSPGQVIQTIKVEKIGSANGPGEERRIVQTFRASGPLVTATGLNSHGSKGNNQTKNHNQRSNGQRPIKLNLNTQSQQNQQRKPPQRPLRPSTTPIIPPNGLKVNGTQSTSVQHSTVLNNSVGKPSGLNSRFGSGFTGTGPAPKVPSASTSSTQINNNKSSASQSNFNSQDSTSSFHSDQSASSKMGSGVTVRRIDSSGRIINGF